MEDIDMAQTLTKLPVQARESVPEKEPARTEPFWGLTPFGRLFEDFWPGRSGWEFARAPVPALDISEDDDAFRVSAELPGMKKEDVKIQCENGVLAISGEKREETETKERNWHRTERRYGTFCRSITLPAGVDVERAEAKYADGVLEVVLPKAESAKPKTLKIK
jgi:HSP20 family protein